MKLSLRSATLYSAAAGLLMLSACSKSNNDAANPPAASSTAAAPAASAAPAVAATAPVAPAASAAAPASAPAASAPAAAAVPTPASAPASAAVAGATGELKVASLTLGDSVAADHKVSKAKTTFAPTVKIIYASVATEGAVKGSATLKAKWTYLDKNQVVLTTGQSISENPVLTTFKAQNPNAWPEGKYEVEISLDGKTVASQDFEIKKR